MVGGFGGGSAPGEMVGDFEIRSWQEDSSLGECRGGYGLGQHDRSDVLLVFGDNLVSDRVCVRKYMGDIWPPWEILRLRFSAVLRFKLCSEVDLIGVSRWEEDGNECLVS